MALVGRRAGLTVFGSVRERCALGVDAKAGTASGLVLVDTAGVEYYLWIDNTGDLKIGTRANFESPNTAGTVIGTQS